MIPTRTTIALLAAALLAFAPGCAKKKEAAHDDHHDQRSADQHEPAHGDEHAGETAHRDEHAGEAHAGDHAGDEGGTLPLEGVRGLTFVTAPQPHAHAAWFPAEAVGDVDAQRDVTAPVAGIVTQIRVASGRSVAKGTALLTLQSPELARLKADWLTAGARLERAEAELAREERLLAAGAGSQRDVEVARAEAHTVRAEREAARLALEARGLTAEGAGAHLTIAAPASGTVTAWDIHMGESVAAGQKLGAFQARAAALARLELAPPPPARWTPGEVTEARAADGRAWRAVLEGVPAALGAESRRLTYTLRLSGASLPLPGMPLQVHVPLATAPALPQTAVQQVEGKWGVFVKEGGSARFVPIRRGAEVGTEVLVLDGVKPGDLVVNEGAYLLKSLMLRRSGGEEHHEH